MGDTLAPFAPWLERWNLTPDGAPFLGPWTGNHLVPVRQAGVAAVLKIAHSAQEQLGGRVLAWWAGQGGAPVLAQEGEALLMVRAVDAGALKAMAREGRDEAADTILCAAIAALHRPRPTPPPEGLLTLAELFRALREAAGRDDRLQPSWAVAEALLADPRDVVVLHGDMHHENVLDFGPPEEGGRGWLAIDPWGVIGERTYDYANIARNPDLETAIKPGRLAA
jgi:streptomycin 6-kinase